MSLYRLIPRFTVLRLMVAVAIVAALMAFFVSIKGAYWVGFANVPLRFMVLDGASGRPIPRAYVRLAGNPVYESPPTDDDGKTTIVVKVICSGEEGILRRTRHANFSPWRLRVVAPGHGTLTENLEDRTLDPRANASKSGPRSRCKLVTGGDFG